MLPYPSDRTTGKTNQSFFSCTTNPRRFFGVPARGCTSVFGPYTPVRQSPVDPDRRFALSWSHDPAERSSFLLRPPPSHALALLSSILSQFCTARSRSSGVGILRSRITFLFFFLQMGCAAVASGKTRSQPCHELADDPAQVTTTPLPWAHSPLRLLPFL